MSDLISRQAAIDAIKHNQDIYSNNFGGDAIDKYTVAIIANDLETLINLPSAERLEVQSSGCEYWDSESNFCSLYRPSAERQGRWIFNIDDKGWSWDKPYMCDQCGEWNGRETPYCPVCGSFNGEGGENDELQR